MNKAILVSAAVLLALSIPVFAQDRVIDPAADSARQERMNAAYEAHRDGTLRSDVREVGHTIRDDTRAAGHAIHHGVRETGHAIHRGVRATGHAIHQGVRATGHAIHKGVDKVIGR